MGLTPRKLSRLETPRKLLSGLETYFSRFLRAQKGGGEISNQDQGDSKIALLTYLSWPQHLLLRIRVTINPF